MNAQTEITRAETAAERGLRLAREPFPAHQISKLPKPTAKQTETVKQDFKTGIRCQICGAWHHKDVVHLDYVGHAALTDRLLECDPMWNWEPMALTDKGTPLLDDNGGMWIKLTLCGVTRKGYGHADGKRGGDAIKEVIGDALRNAAMRFGMALDLWHKGDLHLDDDAPDVTEQPRQPEPGRQVPSAAQRAVAALNGATTLSELGAVWTSIPNSVRAEAAVIAAKDARKAALTVPVQQPVEDEIPY